MQRAALGSAIALTVLAIGVLSSDVTGATPPNWNSFRADGLSVRYPPGWYATKRQLTPVDYPFQVLAVASYRFPKSTSPNGCMPAGTLAAMPAGGAFIFGIEYVSAERGGSIDSRTARNFSPRPAHFRLRNARRYECFGGRRSYLLRFRESGRFFQLSIAFGRGARTAGTRATVLRILDSFKSRQ